jgi:hypothetical protein
MPCATDSGEAFGNLEAPGHVGVNGTQENAMDGYALTCQHRPQ